MKCILLMAMLLGSIADVLAFNDIQGKVTVVIDGNTLEVQTQEADVYKIVLAGIDCPELDQQFGMEAKKFLEKRVLKKAVRVQLAGKDRFGNYLGILFIEGDEDLRIELLKEGLAWTAEKNPHPDLEPYRTWAEQKKRGLWKEENPTPPWTHRRQQSMANAKSSS